MPTLRQTKLIKLIRENMGNLDSTATMSDLMLRAGYTKATAKNAYLIFESKAIKKATDDIADMLADKRKMAITHITERKLKDAPARELAYVADVFTKNIQLITGRSTNNVAMTVQLSEAVARKYMTEEELSNAGLIKLDGGGDMLS